MTTDPAPLERNLRLYPWLQVGHSAVFWLPVFVLYFSEHLDPAAVLQLEAVYYAGVVLLEVPSGYLSDRLGRRPVLLVAGVSWALGSALIATGSSFAPWAAGQLLLGTGRAFLSGTDTSLLYDTLEALGRPHELARREARAQAWGSAALALAALAGGLVASHDLRLGHALTAVAGLVAVAAPLGMTEPPVAERAPAPLAQARAVLASLGDPVLRWTAALGVGLTVWTHVPYELLQPWLAELVDTAAPVAAGVVTCVVMGLAAVAGPRGPDLAERLGTRATLFGAWALLLAVIAGMAATVHPLLVPLLALRGVPRAVMEPLLAALVHPRVASGLRATWLSAQSLVGRLAFSLALLLAAEAVGARDGWTLSTMQAVLVPAVALGAAWGLVCLVLSPALGER